MEAFDYLSVLISIILGLGITQILVGFGGWLQNREEYRAYAPAIAWGAVLLLIHVQTWWSMYGLRHFESWTFLQFAVVLMQPVVLFLLATIVFPSPGARQPDLEENFFRQRRWFFGLFVGLLMVSLARDLARTGSLPSEVNVAFHGLLFGVGATGFLVERDLVHRLLAYGSLVLFLTYIALLFAQLA